MATISFGGLGNGLDFGQVVDQLVKAAHTPVDRLNSKKDDLNSKSTDYATLSTKLIALQSAADKMRLVSNFDRSSVSASDSTVLTATGASTAVQGSYTVKVTQLAQSHQVTNKAAKAVASTTTDIVSGASGTFTFRVGSGSNQTVNLSATATIEDLKTAINDLGAGVTASVVNAGSEASPAYRLVLTAATTGASSGVTIVADDTNLDFLNGSGTGGTDTLQAAQDAVIVVGDPNLNPLTFQRSSNTITDAIAGVTLTLAKTTGSSTVAVNVSRDVTAVQTNIKDLATAYNEVVKFINERNTYDVTTKKGGIFFNEPTVRTVLSQLRSALSSIVPGLTTYTSVGEIGFKTERDGTVSVDEAKLNAALSSNYAAVKDLFVNQTSSVGVAQLLNASVNTLSDIESGAVTLRKNGLTHQISDLTDEITRKEDVLAQYEERLRQQYAALDGLLKEQQSQLSSLQANSSLTGGN
ncbi:MAG: flagellar filament capping protein FliD [Nitrospira sp. BO4]|jgi:flagellar hook-associated protein 2|nr:flagellar filament capping protein FliD [Nitrospira sp. BO4]